MLDLLERLLESRVLRKGAWVAQLLGTLLGVRGLKKVKFPGQDNSSLAVKDFSVYIIPLVLFSGVRI